MKIEIEIFFAGGCWNADYSLDGITTHLTEAFCTELDAFQAVARPIESELNFQSNLRRFKSCNPT